MSTRYDGYQQTYRDPRWDAKLNSGLDKIGDDIDAITSDIAVIDVAQSSLNDLVTNWVTTENYLIYCTATPSYVDGDTFTVPGDLTSSFPTDRIIHAYCGSDGMVYSSVASSSHLTGTTTVEIDDSVLTSNLLHIFFVAARNGLSIAQSGQVFAADYGVPGLATLQAAIAAIGVSERTLVVGPGDWELTDDVSIGTNISLVVQKGAIFEIADTKLLTINGSFQAGLYQVFDDKNATYDGVKFGPGAIKEMYPQWWGATGDGVTDDTAALQAVIACAQINGEPDPPLNNFPSTYFGGVIRIPDGIYIVSDKFTINTSGVHIIGTGKGNTTIWYKAGSLTTEEFLFTIEPEDVGGIDGPKIRPFTMRGIQIRGDAGDDGLTAPRAIFLHEVHDYTIQDVHVAYMQQGIKATYGDFGYFVNCAFQHCYRASAVSGMNQNKWIRCKFINCQAPDAAADAFPICQLQITGSCGISIDACDFEHIETGSDCNLYLGPATRGISITNCYWEANDCYAIYFYGAAYSQNAGVTGCVIQGNFINHDAAGAEGKGIYFDRSSTYTDPQHKGIVITGNYGVFDPATYLVETEHSTNDVEHSYVGQNYNQTFTGEGTGELVTVGRGGFNAMKLRTIEMAYSLSKLNAVNGAATTWLNVYDGESVNNLISVYGSGYTKDITTSAVKISSINGQTMFLVSGISEADATVNFVDLVLACSYDAATVVSTNERGACAARTYSVSDTDFKVLFASGTYNVTVQAFEGRPAIIP